MLNNKVWMTIFNPLYFRIKVRILIMIRIICYVLLLTFAQCAVAQISDGITSERKVVQAIKVADVWSGHPVRFDILTAGQYQYVAYYDANRNMCIAQRKMDGERWKVKILPSRVGWDSHNSIVMTTDKSGFLHVSGNMHADPLVYFRSTKPHDIGEFETHSMVGTEEDRATYPVFFKDGSGDLFFQYRDGGSGNGVTYINRYDHKKGRWERVLDQGLFDGEGETNAYPGNPVIGPDGYFHYMWTWRLTPVANTNHNLSYARTKDFKNFENIRGEAIEIPIKYRERKVIADPIGPWNGLMNSSKKLSFDSNGRVIMGYHKFDKEGRSQLFLCHYHNGEWINRQVSQWPDFSWEINKTGSLGRDIGLYEIKNDGTGHLYMSYSHKIYGSGIMKIDEETLKPKGDFKGATFYSISGLSTDTLPNMQINQFWSDDKKYLLQWQTLPVNFDRPHNPPYPDPTELVLYEVN